MGLTKPIEQYLFSNLLIRIHVFMYLKDIIRGGNAMNPSISPMGNGCKLCAGCTGCMFCGPSAIAAAGAAGFVGFF